MGDKKRVLLLMFDIPEVFGGAERQFADIYDYYQDNTERKIELYLLMDKQSIKYLKDVNRLHNPENIISVPTVRFKYINIILRTLYSLYILKKFNIKLLHIPLPARRYYPLLLLLNKIPKRIIDTKIVFNATDCRIAFNYEELGKREPHKLYMENIKFDAIYSWYEVFTKKFSTHKVISGHRTPIMSAKYCFTNIEPYVARNKKNHIVWAARLIDVKNPLMFIEAVAIFKNCYWTKNYNWEFFIYGDGELKEEVQKKIKKLQLEDILEYNYSNMMDSIFAQSKLFVSTQSYENFTSLSMLEAMALGNAVIARNVGQTNYFLKDKENGYIMKKDTPEELAFLMHQYITTPTLHQRMADKSIQIVKDIHNIENFINDMEQFWLNIIDRNLKLGNKNEN